MSDPRTASRRVRHLPLLAASVLTVLCATPARAQEVFGVLRAELIGRPAEGVVLTAMRTSDRVIVGRTLTGRAGSFRLGVGRDSVVVMALRIGQQPVELWRGRLAAGARRDIGRTLPDMPVTIASLRVREAARCGAAPAGESSVTRTLFADALTALAASLSSTEGEALVVRTATTEQFRDLRDNVQRTSVPVIRAGATTQPFRSVPVAALMRDGFVVTDFDGSMLYRAPDAHVLTSDAFLERYCLSLDLSREADGLVGIRFAPQRRQRNHVDVRGALWLDLPTRALRRLEFGYVGLPQPAASASPGGTVEYAQLADGRWIIDRWSLRMATLSSEIPTTRGAFARAPQLRATGVQVVSATVLEARLRGALLYSVGGAPAERALTGLPDPDSAAGASSSTAVGRSAASGSQAAPGADSAALASARAIVVACGESGAATAAVAGVVRRGNGAAVTGATVEAEWRGRFVTSDDRPADWELARVSATTDAEGRFVLCALPREARVTVVARVEDTRSQPAQLRLPTTGAVGELELVLEAARFGVVSVRPR